MKPQDQVPQGKIHPSNEVHYRNEWMEICRGLPASKVVQILNKYMPGTTWTGCNKSYMAEAWIDAHVKQRQGFGGRITDVAALRKELEEAPRESSSERKQKRAKRTLEKRVAELKAKMELAQSTLEDTTTDALVEAFLKLKPAASEIEMVLRSWKDESRALERRLEAIRKDALYIAQLEMVAQRALNRKRGAARKAVGIP